MKNDIIIISTIASPYFLSLLRAPDNQQEAKSWIVFISCSNFDMNYCFKGFLGLYWVLKGVLLLKTGSSFNRTIGNMKRRNA